MLNCDAPINGLKTAKECIDRCTNYPSSRKCYSANFDEAAAYCQLCLNPGFQIEPNPTFDFYYQRDCSNTKYCLFNLS
jgi:hypothetical protein